MKFRMRGGQCQAPSLKNRRRGPSPHQLVGWDALQAFYLAEAYHQNYAAMSSS